MDVLYDRGQDLLALGVLEAGDGFRCLFCSTYAIVIATRPCTKVQRSLLGLAIVS